MHRSRRLGHRVQDLGSEEQNMEDSVKLMSYTRKNSRRRRPHGDCNGGDDPQMELFSDSELTTNNKEKRHFEDSTVFSDNCEDLPSSRARLAASRRFLDSQRSRSNHQETTPLLNDVNADRVSDGVRETNFAQMDEKPHSVVLSPPTSKEKSSSKWKKWLTIFKIAFLTTFVIGSVLIFSINDEHEEDVYYVSVQNDKSRAVVFNDEHEEWKFFSVSLYGPFIDLAYDPRNDSTESCSHYVFMCGGNGMVYSCENFTEPGTYDSLNCHSFLLGENFNLDHSLQDFSTIDATLTIHDEYRHNYSMMFFTTNLSAVEFQITVVKERLDQTYQVIIAAVILVFVYILIGFDIIHRTLAAIIGSTCTLGVLSMLDKRPTLLEVVEWIDLDTICLLFGMMTLVAIFSQTGFFDYSAVKAYKIARGRVWPLITLLCFFAAIVSAFLDNVTTILLLTPVSIRLCQVLNLDPRPILIAEVVFSNVGGTATAIGDPPNVIIVSNKLIKEVGIDFSEFTLHLVIGIIPCLVVAYGALYLLNRFFISVKNKDSPNIAELKREIGIWERTAQRLNVVSLEERGIRDALMAKATEVRNQLAQEVDNSSQSALDMWQKNLAELESRYRITNRILLLKSSIVLFVVIVMFFISNLLPGFELELGWIAIFGGVVLLLLADVQDMESVLHKIEWGTLLFFAALFVLMEGLGELGLIQFIGDLMVTAINAIDVEWQMFFAIFVVVWVSAIASSFIDNIPFTTAMIPVISDLANSRTVCLQLRPLVWALAFGACLGGNGTLIGASANVVCAGIAEQSGYKITFFQFFKIGFPMMIVTTFTAWVYLMVAHSAIGWNTEKAQECVAEYIS